MIQNQTKKSGRSPDIQSTEICRFFVYVCGQKLCILQIFHLEPVFLAVSIHFGAFITADRTGPVDDPRTDKIRIMTDFQIFQFRTSVEDPLANVAQVFRKNYVGEIFSFEKSTVINISYGIRKQQLSDRTGTEGFPADTVEFLWEKNILQVFALVKSAGINL